MKIFVSYALSDRDWVHRFASSLRAAGTEVSSWGSSFHLAGDSSELLERRMAAVDFVVLVLSDGFTACTHVITSVMIDPADDQENWLAASTARAVRSVQDYAVAGPLVG